VTPAPEPKERFTSRVADYARFRPGYPLELIDALCEQCELARGADVAELGSGTGIFTRLLLDRGMRVFAVEPNDAMRAAAESTLGSTHGFTSLCGTAEATGLSPESVDVVTAAQAFHWFDVARTRAECRRILRGNRHAALVWNERDADATPFLRDLEVLLHRFGTDYGHVVHRDYDESKVREFFGGTFTLRCFPNAQDFDLDGLIGRVQSASYVPARDDARNAPMMAALTELHARHAERSIVRFLYTAKLYVGRIR
jgi:SAM-dependent methyltransferase